MHRSGPEKKTQKYRFFSGLVVGCLLAVSTSSRSLAQEEAIPSLLGAVTSAQILQQDPQWSLMHEAYAPLPAAVESIRAAARAGKGELKVEVVFGSWCEDSLHHVPSLIKILEQVGSDLLPAEYFGVDRSKKDPQGRTAAWKIDRVPTLMVTRRGVEIGRIVENPKVSLEADLAGILSAHPPH